jgi:hypothetical protein
VLVIINTIYTEGGRRAISDMRDDPIRCCIGVLKQELNTPPTVVLPTRVADCGAATLGPLHYLHDL